MKTAVGVMEHKCPGCEGSDKPPTDQDHSHQFINILGNTVTIYLVDSVFLKNHEEATTYIQETLECTRFEASEFLFSLPKKYN